jgi:hypothetical protein
MAWQRGTGDYRFRGSLCEPLNVRVVVKMIGKEFRQVLGRRRFLGISAAEAVIDVSKGLT